MRADEPALVIRRAAVDDAAALADFAARTFAETFAADNRPEHMAVHLATSFGVAQQTAEILDQSSVTLLGFARASGAAGSEASGDAGVLAAFAQIRCTAPPACVTEEAPIEIHRFCLDRRWHGRGVGAGLMEAALDVARELGGRSAWLSVWERNPRAIAFYVKCGFVRVGSTDFWVGPDRQTDHVLARAL